MVHNCVDQINWLTNQNEDRHAEKFVSFPFILTQINEQAVNSMDVPVVLERAI